MATRDDQDPNNAAADWWSQHAPPPTATTTPPGGAGPIPTNPDGSQVGSGIPWDPKTGAPAYNPPGYHWDPKLAMFQPGDAPGKAGTPDPGTTPPTTPTTAPIGLPTTGFGAAPPPYASDPNAPTFDPLPAYVAPTWTGGDYVPPTVQDLENSPGYQARMDAVLKARNRSAAAQGTVLNGGTLIALDRDAQNFASNEYQTLNANTLDAYKLRYSQFTDAAGRDLSSRTVNANDNLDTFANRTKTYAAGNARTLSDYLTNVTSKRNAELDYWNRLNDLNRTGSDLAGNSR